MMKDLQYGTIDLIWPDGTSTTHGAENGPGAAKRTTTTKKDRNTTSKTTMSYYPQVPMSKEEDAASFHKVWWVCNLCHCQSGDDAEPHRADFEKELQDKQA